MAGFGRYLYNTLSNTLWGSPVNNDSMDERNEQHAKPPFNTPKQAPHQVSTKDVFEVKQLLFDNFDLPLELVDVVIDFAEYWPFTTSIFHPQTPLQVRSGAGHENKFLLRTLPLGFPQAGLETKYSTTAAPQPWSTQSEIPNDAIDDVLSRWAETFTPKGEFPCRKVVFTLKSHDQGWGGSFGDKGTYRGSFTWFDVGLERVKAFRADPNDEEAQKVGPSPQFYPFPEGETSDRITCCLSTILPRIAPTYTSTPNDVPPEFEHPLLPERGTLQRNVVADKNTKEHVITWTCNDNILPESLDGTALEEQGRGRDTGTGEFMRNLKIGDVITVWAKARFPQWVNVIEEVKIDVYWAV